MILPERGIFSCLADAAISRKLENAYFTKIGQLNAACLSLEVSYVLKPGS